VRARGISWSTVRFMVNARTVETGRWANRKWVRATRSCVDSYDLAPAALLARRGWSLTRGTGWRNLFLSLSLSPSLSLTDTRYVYFASSAETDGPPLFFSNNGAIFGAAEMEIYLITDTRRARYGCGGSGYVVCFVRRGLRVDGILSILAGGIARDV